jgi:two-component system sensor histidine kinase RstB
MTRLFLQTFIGMILTLTAAATVAYWLLNHPINWPNQDELDLQLSNAAREIIGQLSASDDSKWELIVDRYLEHFDYSVFWGSVDDPRLTESERAKLRFGEPVVLDPEEGERAVLLLVPGTSKLLGVAPRMPIQIQDPMPVEIGIAVVGVLIVVGIFGLLLVIPVVKRLNSLAQAAQTFGRGDWTARADDRRPDAIGKLAGAFNSMANQIERLIQDKTSLLSDQQELLQAVAHEFRGPMSRLNFALDMALEAEPEEFIDEYANDMGAAISELNDLVTEVLRYSRLQPGTPDLNIQNADIEEIITEVIEQQSKLSSSIHFIKRALADRSVTVNIDPHYFHRALMNLITNAVRYARTRVRISWGLIENSFWVTVEDDGLGIPQHKRDRIFEPFTRLDPSRSRHSGGIGLGLAIVERISKKHHGEVTLDDSPLGGARFRLCWPTNIPVST